MFAIKHNDLQYVGMSAMGHMRFVHPDMYMNRYLTYEEAEKEMKEQDMLHFLCVEILTIVQIS